MKTTIALLIFLLALARTTTYARVGESIAELDARYGANMIEKPAGPANLGCVTTRLYITGDFGVLAGIAANGKCVSSGYSKFVCGSIVQLSEEEIKIFLAAENPAKWSKTQSGSWKSDNRFACMVSEILMVFDKDMMERLSAAKDAKETAELSRF